MEPDDKILSKIAYANRINSLACIMAAKHGWIGATFSCAEVLTYLYFEKMNFSKITENRIDGDMLILSKGHAAPMQYACLAGLGVIPFEMLLTYKTKDGLQAHTDKMTPGIVSNTGSLGQSLSKACGLALAGRIKKIFNRIYVVVGDGELQEGQNYEALMTLKKFNISEVVPIIDRNYIQTDSAVKDIKDIGNLEKIFSGFGFSVRRMDGHNIADIRKNCEDLNYRHNNILIADTIKGYGSKLTGMDRNIGRRKAVWHSAIPGTEQYFNILEDLVERVHTPEISADYLKFRKNLRPVDAVYSLSSAKSARDVFSKQIIELAEKNRKIVVLDADLEKSMRLTEFAQKYPERFLEMGIAEQDMVSVAGGLALNGFLPIVNTYASFFRRAFEQIYINSTEKLPIVYAGHYSGLSYSTDGKSHQMTGDIPMMRTIPTMHVFDPFCNEELANILSYYLNNHYKRNMAWNYPVYIKLRRSPAEYTLDISEKYEFGIDKGFEIVKGRGLCFVPAGPHLTAYCVKVASENFDRETGVVTFSAQNYLNERNVCRLLSKYKKIIVVEENVTAGGLGDEISGILDKNNVSIKIIRKGVDDFTFSARDKDTLFDYFGLGVAGLKKAAKKALSGIL